MKVTFLKNTLLFLIVCGLDGVCIFLGSVLGNSMGRNGLFVGAIIGGLLGVAAAVWSAVRCGLLDRTEWNAAFFGGVLGFAFAAVTAVMNLHGPLIPFASVGLIGLGVVLGKMLRRRRPS